MYRLTVFYDGECPICAQEIALLTERDVRGEVLCLAIDDHPQRLAEHGIERQAALTQLHVLDEQGRLLVGMAACRAMYRVSGWTALAKVLSWPLIRPLTDALYPWFARNRYRFPAWLLGRPRCDQGTCQRPGKP